MFDEAGTLRLAERVADNGDTEILRVDADGFTKIYSCTVFESCGAARFHKDGTRVYLQTNKGDADLIALVLLDPATGKEEAVESDPEKRVDFGQAIFSDATDELVATTYEDERIARLLPRQGLRGRLQALAEAAPRQATSPSPSQTEGRAALAGGRDRSDTEPGATLPLRPQDQEADAAVPRPRARCRARRCRR